MPALIRLYNWARLIRRIALASGILNRNAGSGGQGSDSCLSLEPGVDAVIFAGARSGRSDSAHRSLPKGREGKVVPPFLNNVAIDVSEGVLRAYQPNATDIVWIGSIRGEIAPQMPLFVYTLPTRADIQCGIWSVSTPVDGYSATTSVPEFGAAWMIAREPAGSGMCAQIGWGYLGLLTLPHHRALVVSSVRAPTDCRLRLPIPR